MNADLRAMEQRQLEPNSQNITRTNSKEGMQGSGDYSVSRSPAQQLRAQPSGKNIYTQMDRSVEKQYKSRALN